MKTSYKYPRFMQAAVAFGVVGLLSGCLSQLPVPVRGAGSPPPAEPSRQVVAQTDGRTHVVRPGDTLLGIGRVYNRSVADLVAWNSLENPHQIQVGQRLRVVPPDLGGRAEAGVVVAPIEFGSVESTTAPSIDMPPPVFDAPKGGRTPYSDQAWAAISPDALPSAPPPAPVVPAPPAASVPAPAPAAPAAKPSPWLWPANGPILERFDETSNKGVDIGGKPGDPILASAAGNVVYAGSGLRGYGKLVIIKHDDDYLTAYAHNQTLLVKEGEKVARGQKIAELGSTDADRPKLHFEIRRQGRPVDPMQYLPVR